MKFSKTLNLVLMAGALLASFGIASCSKKESETAASREDPDFKIPGTDIDVADFTMEDMIEYHGEGFTEYESFLDDLSDSAKNAVEGIAESEAFKSAKEGASNALKEASGAVKDAAGAVAGSAREAIETAVENEGVQAAKDVAKDAAKSIGDGAKNLFGSIVDSASDGE